MTGEVYTDVLIPETTDASVVKSIFKYKFDEVPEGVVSDPPAGEWAVEEIDKALPSKRIRHIPNGCMLTATVNDVDRNDLVNRGLSLSARALDTTPPEERTGDLSFGEFKEEIPGQEPA